MQGFIRLGHYLDSSKELTVIEGLSKQRLRVVFGLFCSVLFFNAEINQLIYHLINKGLWRAVSVPLQPCTGQYGV